MRDDAMDCQESPSAASPPKEVIFCSITPIYLFFSAFSATKQKIYWAKSTGFYIRALSQVPAKLVDHARLCFQEGYFPIFRYPLC
ncbi:hypothetical protein OS31_29940 [Dickeya oryzae]